MSSVNGDESDDGAPESISFGAGKEENLEQVHKMKEQINSIRDLQKKRRIERQEKYIEQKKKKFEDMKLAEDVLDAIGDDDENAATKSRNSKSKLLKASILSKKKGKLTKIVESAKSINNSISDYIPVKNFKNYGISVVNLESTNRVPLIASDRAKQFKNIMHDRKGIRRQTAQESIRFAKKRQLVKT